MDKYEYNLKLDQMKSLYAEENYEAAAEIADTINWNKIRNVNTLVRTAEIYEKTGRFEDCKEVLLLAYDRSPIGRMIIYRLAEVAIKMEDFTAAEDYYEEFVEIAPHDTLKYVLRYNIKKAKGADYKELIPILEELKEDEYSEEWAYELAYLYHKAGESDKCIDTCDELILWFGDGPYVERALELKMLYQPLTIQQEEKYRSFRQKKAGVTQITGEEMERAGEYVHEAVEIPQVSFNTEKFNTVNLQEEIARGMQQILEATEKETVSDTMDNIKKMVEEIPYLQLPNEGEIEHKDLHIETDEEIDGSLKINFQELIGEDDDGQMSLMVSERMMLEQQITGQMSIADVLEEWERTKRAAEAALQEAEQRKLESAKARALQEAGDIMDRLTDVIPKLDAGVSPKELLEQQYLMESEHEFGPVELASEVVANEALEAANVLGAVAAEVGVAAGAIAAEAVHWEAPKLEQKESDEIKELEPGSEAFRRQQEQEAGQIFVDMNNMLGKQIERLNNENAFFDEQIARATESDAMDADLSKEETMEELQLKDELTMENSELDTLEQLIEKAADLPEEMLEDSSDTKDAKAIDSEGIEADEKTTDSGDTTGELEETEDESGSYLRAREEISSVEDKENLTGIEDLQDTEALEDIEGLQGAEAIEDIEALQGAEALEDIEALQGAEALEDIEALQGTEALEDIEGLQNTETKEFTAQTAGGITKEMPDIAEINRRKLMMAETTKLPEITLPEEDLNSGSELPPISKLSDEMKSVFSYFVPVKGMEEQLCQALTGVTRRLASNGNASCGNLIIQGGHGCGKTVLATSVIKALQKEIGKPNGRIGKIDADALNKKEINHLLRKVAGGCLIIENAGKLNRQSAVTLSLLLEQNDSGVLIILEDTSKGIKKALSLDEGFARKFTEKLNVPIFTNDELVSFAKSYSRELGYKIDEMAVLALYNRISNIQRLDQATTLTEVKEIVDEAIEREEKGGLKKAFSILTSKRYTEDDRIILRERDFE